MRAPATSANLGPGFDALGLALGLHDEVEAAVTASGLSIEVSGEGAAELADAEEKHLVVRAMRVAFDDLGVDQPPGLALRCVNRIPHGRGLGSSAAAIVAGILAARALAGASVAAKDALPLASALEGHPDNVAPCLFGGLTIAWLADSTASAHAVRLEPLEEIQPVAFIAPEPVSTKVARGLLPASVPHAHAARNAGRAALLVAALTARPDALFDASEDLLHQDYRAPGHAGHARARQQAARGRGARGRVGRGPVGARVPDRRGRQGRGLGEAGFNRAGNGYSLAHNPASRRETRRQRSSGWSEHPVRRGRCLPGNGTLSPRDPSSGCENPFSATWMAAKECRGRCRC